MKARTETNENIMKIGVAFGQPANSEFVFPVKRKTIYNTAHLHWFALDLWSPTGRRQPGRPGVSPSLFEILIYAPNKEF